MEVAIVGTKINAIHIPKQVKQPNTIKKENKQGVKIDRRFQSFVDEALKTETSTQSIRFSNHAQKRMEQRGIRLDETDLSNLDSAFTRLDKKGSENSLIIYDDLSLIASIKNRTIITASSTDEMTEVTNIDSAIHIKK